MTAALLLPLGMFAALEPAIYGNLADPNDERLLVVGAFGKPRWVDFETRTMGTIDGDKLTVNDKTVAISTGDGRIRVGEDVFAKVERPPYSVRDVSFHSTGTVVSATLYMPSRKASNAVVMVHGSGESHRDNLWYLEQADQLARNGVAVLLPDKRGCGRTTGDWREVGFRELSYDAIAGLLYLERFDQLRSRGLYGLSQGGWIAVLAASIDREVEFVVSVSCSATSPSEQLRHEVMQDFVSSGIKGETLDRAMAIQDAAAAFVANQDWESYIGAIERAKGTDVEPVADGFPRDRSWWMWDWMRRVHAFDPMEALAKTDAPALFVYGEDDERDNVPVRESQRRIQAVRMSRKAPTELRVYGGTGHAMFDRENNRVRRDYLADAAKWIRER